MHLSHDDSTSQLQVSAFAYHMLLSLIHDSELYQLARYTLDQYRGTSVLCRYEIPTALVNVNAQDELANKLNTAIGRVIAQAPTLQVGISGKDTNKPFWIQLESVDLSEHVHWIQLDDSMPQDEQIQQNVARELDSRFFELNVRPGWRVLVMQQSASNILDVLFVWNHPHADGMSGKIFHELLLETLRNPNHYRALQAQGTQVLKFPDSSKQFPPPIEEVAGLPVGPLFVLKEAWNDYKPSSIFPRATQADWAPIQTIPFKTRFQVISIPEGVLSKVLAACKDRKTTLTALLNSMALISLASHIDVKDANSFASSTAIDQRRFVPSHPPAYDWLEPTRTIGNYVSIMTHEYDNTLLTNIRSKMGTDSNHGRLSDDLMRIMWSTSTRVRNEIMKRLEMGLHNDVLGLARFVPNWKKQFLRDVKKPRKLSWFFTNLGAFDEKPTENTNNTAGTAADWSIRRSQFTLSTEIPVAALLLGVSSVKNQELVITCTWQDTVVKESLVDGLTMDLKTWLGQIGA